MTIPGLPDCVADRLEGWLKQFLIDIGLVDANCVPIVAGGVWCRSWSVPCGVAADTAATCDRTPASGVINLVRADAGHVTNMQGDVSFQVIDCDTGDVLSGPHTLNAGQSHADFPVSVMASGRRITIQVLTVEPAADGEALSFQVCGSLGEDDDG